MQSIEMLFVYDFNDFIRLPVLRAGLWDMVLYMYGGYA